MAFMDMQFLFSILLLLLADTTSGYLLPDPPGKYNVTLTTGPLVDYARNNSDAGKPAPRTLMLSVFQPASCKSTVPVPYMPTKTAKYQGPFIKQVFNITYNLSPLFLKARLPVCADSCSTIDDVPILLFQPGYSIPRLYYNVLASAIASEGFMVITIDDPEDTNIVTYPGGHAVINDHLAQTDEAFIKALPDRVTDASFVIDQLSNKTFIGELLPQRGAKAFPTDRVATFGHSEGGVAAVLAAGKDSRIRGAVNLDGSFLERPTSGVSQPVLLMSHGYADDSWNGTWSLLKGPKLWVNIANATHETFSDVPTLLEAAGEWNVTAFGSLLGSVAPVEVRKILVAYITAWMNGVFAGKEGGPLLEGKEPDRFPAISVVKKANF